MSFRLRLTLFFVLIVVLPMVAVVILVSDIAGDSASGKVDARIDAGLRTAENLFAAEHQRSREAAERAATDPRAAAAVGDPRAADLDAAADELRRDLGVAELRLEAANGQRGTAGGKSVATASVDLVDPDGSEMGTVTAGAVTNRELLDRITETTGEEAAIVTSADEVTGTISIEASALPDGGEAAQIEHESGDLRVAATEPLGSDDAQIAIFAPAADEGFLGSRPTLGLALLLFIAVALLAVLFLLRSLQGYVREMLAAARRIGEGDFSNRVPVAGNDEMAGLAGEFNKMSDKLADQMRELRRQRLEIENSVRRIGEAFASGLDRQALLSILIETAVGTCDADYGLVVLRGHVESEAEAGRADEAIKSAALEAEQLAERAAEPVEASSGSAHALASALGRISTTEAPVGVMTVARRDRPFTKAEREVFVYLVGQASTSVENVALHELVSEQAVTDDLTGLANKRAFREAMDKEAARAARFGHHMSLLLVDLDDFKQINDSFGHLQGDEVLRAVGRVLRAESRGIDVPGRYGGEEFVIALPETDAEGAMEVAERVRARIERERVPDVDGGAPVSVTASIGVATLPGGHVDVAELIGAADVALYRAKRAGKNRVEAAEAFAAAVATAGAHDPLHGAQGDEPRRRK